MCIRTGTRKPLCFVFPCLSSSSKINAGVKNLADSYQSDLDKGEDRDAGYIYGPVSPRMFYVGIEHGI